MSDLEQKLTDLVAEERISVEDANAVLAFREFLRDAGPRDKPIRPAVLLKHADLIGFTEAERQELRDVIATATTLMTPEELDQAAADRTAGRTKEAQ